MAISKLKCWYLPSLPDRARGAIDDAAMYHQRVVDVDEEGNLLVSRCVLDHHAQQLFRHLRVRLKLRTLPDARVINSLQHKSHANQYGMSHRQRLYRSSAGSYFTILTQKAEFWVKVWLGFGLGLRIVQCQGHGKVMVWLRIITIWVRVREKVRVNTIQNPNHNR